MACFCILVELRGLVGVMHTGPDMPLIIWDYLQFQPLSYTRDLHRARFPACNYSDFAFSAFGAFYSKDIRKGWLQVYRSLHFFLILWVCHGLDSCKDLRTIKALYSFTRPAGCTIFHFPWKATNWIFFSSKFWIMDVLGAVCTTCLPVDDLPRWDMDCSSLTDLQRYPLKTAMGR